jgi:O-antigen/teichoic acid export membrane protein
MTASDPAVAEPASEWAEEAVAPPPPAGRSDQSPLQSLKNIVTNYGALFVLSLSNILLTPLLLTALGPVDYGILRLTSSVIGYMGLLDLGVSTSIIYFVARYHSTGERRALDRYVTTVFNAVSLLAMVVIAICAVAAPAVAAFLGVPADSLATGADVVRLSSLWFTAHLLGGVFGGVLIGRGRFDVNNLISITYSLVTALGTFFLIRLGYGLLAVVLFNVVTAAAGAVGRAVAAGAMRLVTVAIGRISATVLRSSIGYGFWSFLNNVAGTLSFAVTDMVILARVLGVSGVAVYAVAVAPIALVAEFVFQSVNVFQPVITNQTYRRDAGSGEAGGVTSVAPSFLLLLKTSVLLGWGPTLLVWLAGRQILVLWVGDIGVVAGDLMIALSFAFGWNYIGHAAGLVLLGTAKHQVLGAVALVGAVLNVALSYAFAVHFGQLGVAYGTAIVMGVTEMIILPVYTCRLVRLPVRKYVDLVVRAAVCLPVAYGIGLAAGMATLGPLGLGMWMATAAECLAGGTFFLAAFWLVILARGERDLLLRVVREILHRR